MIRDFFASREARDLGRRCEDDEFIDFFLVPKKMPKGLSRMLVQLPFIGFPIFYPFGLLSLEMRFSTLFFSSCLDPQMTR